MTEVTTRHIPLDFYEWNDFINKKRATTLCGKRTTSNFLGIPGVTEQEMVVYRDGIPYWGWCLECAYEFSLRLFPPKMTPENTPTEIFMLHNRAGEIIRRAAEAYERSRT